MSREVKNQKKADRQKLKGYAGSAGGVSDPL